MSGRWVTAGILSAVLFGAIPVAPGAAAAEGGSVVKIASGSAVPILSDGRQWTADSHFQGGRSRVSSRTVAGADVPALYRTSREGVRAYAVPVADGDYTVTLKMAETFWRGPRKRAFDVSIEGTRVLRAFDVLRAAGGADRAVDRSFRVRVSDGRVDIAFRRVRGVPTVSAIEVVPAASVSPGERKSRPARPVWADEFNGPAGQLPDPAKWGHDWGGLGWGSGELQEYTDRRTENSSTDGAGHLRLTARKEALSNAWSGGAQYTSARMSTEGRYALQYGRVEVRAKVPQGQGIWPAAWLLGTDLASVGWPASGEIDIFETINDARSSHSHLHGPTTSGGHWSLGAELRRPSSYADGFHVYAMDWRADRIAFFVDGALVREIRKSAIPSGAVWVFDKPYYLLLNIAVGGSWPGDPDATTEFPAEMLVDYVRVYAQP